MKEEHGNTAIQAPGELVSFDVWLNSINKTRTTGWRWRRDGVVRTENIFGRVYISREEIGRFEYRAKAGEFHRVPVVPEPRRA